MPATAEKVQTHSFYSRGREERLIRQPLNRVTVMTGGAMQQVQTQDRIAYDFAPDGRLEVREGQDTLPDGPLDAAGEPTMQDALAWLTSHPLVNQRFWHEGHEPDRPLPTENDYLDIVNTAAVDLAVEPIMVALEQERATHNRPVLVAAAERALTLVQAKLAALEAEMGDLPPAA